jgi:iron complex outermembrane receptor protein
VVNIVTRPADLTQGPAALVAAGAGYQSYTARYGGKIGPAGAFRIYGRKYERADTLRDGEDAGDGWSGGQVGFRTDFGWSRDHVTVQGDAYHDHVPSEIPSSPEGKLVGQNLLGRWTHSFSDTSELEVQSYYDRYERIARGILDGVKTYDIQAQQRLAFGAHHVVIGAGHRRWSDRFENFVNGFVLDPPHRRFTLSNAFVQDQIDLGDVTLTLGLKGEHSSFGGTEWLPNARLAWRLSHNALLWGAVSRAVRNPSRLDRDLTFPPFLLRSDFQPERLVAYEVGYRANPTPRLSFSATVFYHNYEGVRSNEATPGTIIPLRIGNGLEGETWGLEAWGDADITDSWRLSAGGSALGKSFRAAPGSMDRSSLAAAGHDPDFQAMLRSQNRLAEGLNLDVRLRYVDAVPAELTPGYVKAPAYAEADARLSWRVSDRVELSVAGFNLLDAAHPEASEPRRTEMRRNFQVALRYGW